MEAKRAGDTERAGGEPVGCTAEKIDRALLRFKLKEGKDSKK